MITIQLTKGQYTIVDEIDSDLSILKWWALEVKNGYYACRTTTKKETPLKPESVLLHRVILARIINRPLLRKEQVDHINLNCLDNRRENLRVASVEENGRNRLKNKNNTTGYKGVIRHGSGFHALIGFQGKVIHLGTFGTPEEAYEKYCEAAKFYHGEFANFE